MTENDLNNRPNPDLLLKAIQNQEEKSGKGKLKVFLGMAAGVGKTYSMLCSASELKSRGIDVVIGFVETHGRKETEVLIKDLEVIPRRIVPYRGIVIEEMNLDAALQRHPQVILIDEAAHTNAPGSRHSKRWLDILEILDSGIDVYTTLNVQHLESLVDTIHEITAIKVTETIPDSIIDIADEVILIDLAPEELIKRLEEGKVYSEERAIRAMENFFRPGNLSALREISLRLVAERVNRELRDYQQVHHISDSWRTTHRLMVAIYASPYSEILIRWTRRMASGLNAEWYAAYVESDRSLTDEEGQLLARNLSLVKELGGIVLTTVDDDPVRGLLRLARENHVSQLVVGKSRRGVLHNLRRGGSVVGRLLKESGNIDVYVVSGEPLDESYIPARESEINLKHLYKKDFPVTLGALILFGIAGYLLNPILRYHTVGLIFLIAVVLLGLFVGRFTVLLGAILFGFIWNFFFIPPYYTFAISAPEDIMMFGMFLGAAMLIGNLTTRLRLNERHLRIREQRVTVLYQFTKDISSAKDMEIILNAAIEHIKSVFEAEVAIFVKDPVKGLASHKKNMFIPDEKEKSVAEWVSIHNRPAGQFTGTLPAASALYLPLVASKGTVGVLGLKLKHRRLEIPEFMALVETFARQLAMGIEREQLNDLARHTLLLQESERLYKSILNSVSHELKTPLAAIEGSASALLDPLVTKNPQSSTEFATEILKASQRLSRLVKNLLDMTRLESGMIALHLEMTDIRDLISTAIRYLTKELNNHPVTLKFNSDFPLINIDYLLMEQAISNILHNAAVHTPDGTPVEISADSMENGNVVIRIRDWGTGLPVDNPEQVLEKFFRADPKKSGGTGLGLAIAKGWIEAHGGTLHAGNHPEGGAEFIIQLPGGV